MAKEWFFIDSGGTRRRVKGAHFYDSGGARKTVKAGYFYDAGGVRRQFYVGGLSAPAQGYFPGSNFWMKAGEDANYTGFLGGSYGEIEPDAGAGGSSFPLYPTTDATAHLAQGFYFYRRKSDGQFTAYYYRNPFPNPADSAKFMGFNVYDSAGVLYDSLVRKGAVENVLATAIETVWSYCAPLTVGSNYRYMAHEIAMNTTFVAAEQSPGGTTGFSLPGSTYNTFGSAATPNSPTRSGWSICTLATSGGAITVELLGPVGATDPGKNFICGIWCDYFGILATINPTLSYTWYAGQRVASWTFWNSAKLPNGYNGTIYVG